MTLPAQRPPGLHYSDNFRPLDRGEKPPCNLAESMNQLYLTRRSVAHAYDKSGHAMQTAGRIGSCNSR